MIKSKALYVCDACYIFHNYYKSDKKESYWKSDDLIDDDDYYDDDDGYYAADVYRNGPNVTTDVELEVKNTQYIKAKRHILLSHWQRIQAYDLKEIWKNQIFHTKAQHSCTTT